MFSQKCFYFGYEDNIMAIKHSYMIRFTTNAVLAINLKVYARLEINKERGAIK